MLLLEFRFGEQGLWPRQIFIHSNISLARKVELFDKDKLLKLLAKLSEFVWSKSGYESTYTRICVLRFSIKNNFVNSMLNSLN